MGNINKFTYSLDEGIEYLNKECGFSQQAIAEKLKVHVKTVESYLRGDTHSEDCEKEINRIIREQKPKKNKHYGYINGRLSYCKGRQRIENAYMFYRLPNQDFYMLVCDIISTYRLFDIYSQAELAKILGISQKDYSIEYERNNFSLNVDPDKKYKYYSTDEQTEIMKKFYSLISLGDGKGDKVFRSPLKFSKCFEGIINAQSVERMLTYRDGRFYIAKAVREADHIIDLFIIRDVDIEQTEQILSFLINFMNRGFYGNTGEEYNKSCLLLDFKKCINAVNEYYKNISDSSCDRSNLPVWDPNEEVYCRNIAEYLAERVCADENCNDDDKAVLQKTLAYIIGEIRREEYSGLLKVFRKDHNVRYDMLVYLYSMSLYNRYYKYADEELTDIRTADEDELSSDQRICYEAAVDKFSHLSISEQQTVFNYIYAFVPPFISCEDLNFCDSGYLDDYKTVNEHDGAKAFNYFVEMIEHGQIGVHQRDFVVPASCILMSGLSDKNPHIPVITGKNPTAKQVRNAKKYEIYAKAYALHNIDLTEIILKKLSFSSDDWEKWMYIENCYRTDRSDILEKMRSFANRFTTPADEKKISKPVPKKEAER